MSKLRQFTAISAAALVTAMVSVPAYAQESNDTSAVGNPEIVVTAQFREQKLQDTPLSITAVDSRTATGSLARQPRRAVSATPQITTGSSTKPTRIRNASASSGCTSRGSVVETATATQQQQTSVLQL